MRLEAKQVEILGRVVRQHFGEKTRLLLFGSRLDDQAKGGDIDLYLEPEITKGQALARALIKTRAALSQQLGEQKIDLVIHCPGQPLLPIHQHAQTTGVPIE